MKILIYALGGGLGHVSRAYKLSKYLFSTYSYDKVYVIASFQNLPLFLIQNLNLLWIYPHDIYHLPHIMDNIVQKIKPDIWITDVFPNGIFHELPFLLKKYKFYKIVTVRILQSNAVRIFSEIEYDESWQIEWLPNYMNRYVQNLANKNVIVKLPILQNSDKIIEGKKWIVHTENSDEIQFLKSKHIDFEIIKPLDCYPLPVFKNCHLVTAAGCNILQDLYYINENHYIYPQYRKYDDQWIRLQNYHLIKNWFLGS